MVVVGLLSILVAIVSVNYKAPLRRARLQNTLERIGGLDRRLRLVAINSGHAAELRIDVDKGLFSSTNHRGQEAFAESYKLPSAISLDRILVSGCKTTNEETRLRFTSHGTTATYAICLALPNDEQRWLLIVGRTGQTIVFNDEKDVKPLLSPDRK